jgi:hypothetical protein
MVAILRDLLHQNQPPTPRTRWEDGPEIDDRMGETEAIVRTVVRTIADKPGMLGGVPLTPA